MPNLKDNKQHEDAVGVITLRDYTEFLENVSKGEVSQTAFLKGREKTISRELENEGLITKSQFRFNERGPGFSLPVTITPAGAHASLEWKHYLQESSWLGQLNSSFEKIMWLALGIMATLLGQNFGP